MISQFAGFKPGHVGIVVAEPYVDERRIAPANLATKMCNVKRHAKEVSAHTQKSKNSSL